MNNVRNKEELLKTDDVTLKKIAPRCIKLKKELAS